MFLQEVYSYFHHNVLRIFHKRILQLVQSEYTSPQVCEIMENLLNELKQRLYDGFYGYKVSLCLRNLPAQKRQQLKLKLHKFYERAIAYLQNNSISVITTHSIISKSSVSQMI